jgi:ureidoglycolate hydrolase
VIGAADAARPPRRLRPGRLEAEAFAAFGWLPVPDTDVADGRHTLRFDDGDPHANLIQHHPAEVRRHGDWLHCDVLYRHRRHSQLLVPLDHPAVLVVAAPDVTFADADALGGLAAFAVLPAEAFVLHPGTWHWGPFPTGDRPVTLLNVQARSYLSDNEPADLAALRTPVTVAMEMAG